MRGKCGRQIRGKEYAEQGYTTAANHRLLPDFVSPDTQYVCQKILMRDLTRWFKNYKLTEKEV